MASANATYGSQANHRMRPVYIDVLSSQAFYTSGDHVQGNLRVDPSQRPTRISIIFKGLSSIHDTHAKGAHPDFFRMSQELFVTSGAGQNFDILRKGTASDGKVELPFCFTFPLNVSLAPPADKNWFYSEDSYHHPRFQHSPGFPLPPSFNPPTHGIAPVGPRIVYRLEARMDSSVSGSPRSKVRQELNFIPPAPEYHLSLLQPDLSFGISLPKQYSHQKLIRTRKLYPDYANSSKMDKFKHKLVEKELFFGPKSFSEVPYVKFNIFATSARVLVIGSPVPVIITVQHLQRSESLPNPPDLFLRRVRVQLHSVLSTFVPARPTDSETVDVNTDVVTIFEKKLDKGNAWLLYDGLNLLDVGDVELANDKITPSFTSYGLNLEHELQVEIWGECADREFLGLVCKTPVQIVTHWHSRQGYHEMDPMTGAYETDSTAGAQEVNSESATQESEVRLPAYDFDFGSLATSLEARVPPPPYVG
ncbi:hypothetical protein EJ02DRAFT_403632 [Clathrospora elynae]|uniref:Arrestin-like N-terminal domain-containing protein n=1 Tax=Clathrospora elynae TaxID=706981 RepID=A0A6A5SQ78_9PLEO|nr:hypothetical protein EJ02DRAFT_403632 [Clathrospora elynae]